MREDRVAKGIHVIIADNIDKTESRHGIDNEMHRMKGQRFIIDGFRSSPERMTVEIRGYNWHPDDLIEDCPRKKKQLFHFDPNELHP